jgi:hypothetical protein
MEHLADAICKLSRHWRQNAVVNNGGDPSLTIRLEQGQPDFLESLLPFASTVEWQRASEAMRNATLSYAWVLYNHKTVYIESDLILPVCEDLLKGLYPVDQAVLIQEIVSQALVDEAVHTQMSINAANAVLTFRGLEAPRYNGFFLTQRRNTLLAQYSSAAEKRLAALGMACASETLVTDYLDKIARADAIQPLCRQVTAAHANDELAHSSVFTLVLENVVSHLTDREKHIVASAISNAVAMFANKELQAWQGVLSQLHFPDYQRMLLSADVEPDISVYTAGVDRLLSRTGLADCAAVV